MISKEAITAIAARHGLSEAAVRALDEGLARSGGRAAQWSHPELGGMGQWLAGGLLQVGDMFNHDLKARVAGALADLAAADERREPARSGAAQPAHGDWWPGDLGRPAATGAQNGTRYAVFPARQRLAIDRDGTVTLYDTGGRRLTGAAQAQGAGEYLAFAGPDGPVRLDELPVVA